MEGLKVRGQLVDDNENPLFGVKLRALAHYSSVFTNDTVLGDTLTDKKGQFQMDFTLDPQFINDKKNSIKIQFFIDEEIIMDTFKDIEDNDIDFGVIKFNKGNIGVQGKIVDEKGNPVEGLTIIAEDVDLGKMKLNALELVESKIKSFINGEGALNSSMDFITDKYDFLLPFRDDFLGITITDKNGYYRIIYPPGRYRELLDKDPDIQIIVKDKLGVFELRKTEIQRDVKDTIKKMDDMVINRAEIEGLEVTLNSDSPSRLSLNNNFEILIDNENVLKKIVDAIDEAKSYVYLTQFEFYPDFIPRFFLSPQTESEYRKDDPLVYKLLEVQKRGADVKIIINENAIVPDNYDELYNYFKESKVNVRRFPAKGPYAMHAKVLVVDGKKGFIIGSPFSQSYWDTDKHDINEPRRLNKNEGPLHDVSIYMEGPVITDLEEFFIELWNYLSNLHFDGKDKIKKNRSQHNNSNSASDPKYIEQFKPLLRSENKPLQIVRSITPGTLSKDGETGVLEAYRRAITNAQDFIYIENQYFTNKYIVGALKSALKFNKDLQLIMVINEVPDVPSYRSWQHYGMQFMELDLKKIVLNHPQIGIFAKWSGRFESGKNKLRNCYIHSKVAIVDDLWATIGTSNLDGSSLSCAEEFGSREVSKNHRNMEMNALIFDKQKTGTIEKFRQILWSEHLGQDIINLERPKKGWLDLWNQKSNENMDKLEREEIIIHGGILPYSSGRNTKEQIKDLVEQYRRIKGRFNR